MHSETMYAVTCVRGIRRTSSFQRTISWPPRTRVHRFFRFCFAKLMGFPEPPNGRTGSRVTGKQLSGCNGSFLKLQKKLGAIETGIELGTEPRKWWHSRSCAGGSWIMTASNVTGLVTLSD